MGQLMERIRNGEEIVDEKTRECEEQKLIIRELRKESAQLRARLDAENRRSRSSSVSSEVRVFIFYFSSFLEVWLKGYSVSACCCQETSVRRVGQGQGRLQLAQLSAQMQH